MKRYAEIKPSKQKGKGIFATEDIEPGEIVVSGKREKILKKRTKYSFQIAMNVHVQLDKLSRSINHSCDPNTGVRNNLFGGYDFIALRRIARGEEITWDYETTEFISISIKKCLCRTEMCKKEIQGFLYQNEKIIEKYGIYIADYLKLYLAYCQNKMLEKVLVTRYY